MKINYRPEIDGLRAIAVVAVIVYHAQITIFGNLLFKGGFLGVDIFFVISGYLITSIILKELVTTGNFSFKYFYERRIRRILPALFFVMLISLPFAWLYLLPSSLVDFSKSILYSLGFISNFYFHYSSIQYGAEDGLFIPFLHIWSLSVEEQYYILFPVIFLITFKYFSKYIKYILIIGFIISLFLADWGSKNHPSVTFFSLHSRMWELIAGSLLAYFEISLGSRSHNKIFNQVLPTIGLFLIGTSIIFFNDKMFHPSFYTLIPIIGVCMIIWFSNKDELITKILSTKLFVGIGLISYSLYLWHYPIFAFYRYSFASGSILVKLFLIIILFFASLVSYLLIEKVFRNRKLQFKKVLIFILTTFVLIFLINLIFILKKGFPEKAIIDGISLDRNFYFEEISSWEKQIKEDSKEDSFYNSKQNILIFGDSHSGNFNMIFKTNSKLFSNYNFKNFGSNKKLLLSYLKNNDKDNNNHNLIKKPNIVIFSYNWTDEEFEIVEDIINLIKEKTNVKIVLTTNNPIYKIYGSRYTSLDFFLLKNRRKPNNLELINLEKQYYNYLQKNNLYNSINNKLNEMAQKFQLKLLDKSLYQCDHYKKRCLVLTDDLKKINWDSDHHTLEGARYLGKKINELKWFQPD